VLGMMLETEMETETGYLLEPELERLKGCLTGIGWGVRSE